jgi:hypothetical protein
MTMPKLFTISPLDAVEIVVALLLTTPVPELLSRHLAPCRLGLRTSALTLSAPPRMGLKKAADGEGGGGGKEDVLAKWQEKEVIHSDSRADVYTHAHRKECRTTPSWKLVLGEVYL